MSKKRVKRRRSTREQLLQNETKPQNSPAIHHYSAVVRAPWQQWLYDRRLFLRIGFAAAGFVLLLFWLLDKFVWHFF